MGYDIDVPVTLRFQPFHYKWDGVEKIVCMRGTMGAGGGRAVSGVSALGERPGSFL